MYLNSNNALDLSFENFFDLHLDLLCVINSEGKYISVNKAFESILGYSMEELYMKTAFNLIHPEDLNNTKTLAKECSDIFRYTNRVLHKDGSFRYIEWSSFKKDNLSYSTGRDMTKIILKDKALTEHKMRLEAMANLEGNYIFRASLDYIYLYTNEKYLLAHKDIYQADSLVGLLCFQHHDEENQIAIKKIFEDCIASPNKNFTIEIKKTTINDGFTYTLWQCIALCDSEGNPIEIQAVGTDITLKRLQEEQLKEQKAIQLLEMATPITQLLDNILLLPIMGIMNIQRAESIMNMVLNKVALTQAKILIIDIGGISVIDTQTANYFTKLSKATRLMGCICTVSGISPAVAETMINLGINIQEFHTTASLKDALDKGLKYNHQQLVSIH